jgi:imidazolonepropionase-like amidohydrolase
MRAMLLTVLLIAALVPHAWANERCVVVHGGSVAFADGTREGTVTFRGALITDLGEPAVSEGCERIDASGKVVTAGLIESFSALGLTEVDQEKATVDHSPGGALAGRSVRASFAVADAYNPRSTLVAISRMGGITSAVIAPNGGLISGQSAFVDLLGDTQSRTIQKRTVALHAHLGGGGGSRSDRLSGLRNLFSEARVYRDKGEEWRRMRYRGFETPVVELKAMQSVISGQVPLAVHVDRASDIEALLKLTADGPSPVRLILVGGAEAWMHAKALSDRKIPVLVDPLLESPESFDRLASRPDNAKLLHEAGVSVMFSTFWTHNMRTLAQVAGNAVRAGLDKGAALDAITRIPAEAFGMSDRGSIVVGKRANLVIWSGDPLEVSSAPERIFIGGEDAPLVSRQTRLFERYRELPGTPLPALPLPKKTP